MNGHAQRVHMFLLGGPAAAETNAGMCLIHPSPVLIAELLTQDCQLLIRNDGILLVRGGVEQQGIAVGNKDLPDLERHINGVAGNLEIQIVGKQRVKLDTQQTALGQHAAALLHHKAEVLLQCRVHNDHGFTEQRTYLGAADVKYVAQPC